MDLRASVAARPAAVAAARALAILRFVDFEGPAVEVGAGQGLHGDRKSTRLNSSHDQISYAVFCLKKKLERPGNPIDWGEWLHAPGAPTILFYGHYDVQPVDPLNLRESPPFEATVRDGEIYARGSADDKGQVFMHFKAVEAHLKQGGRLPVNIKFILEGEEEVGSVNLDEFVRAHKHDLTADVVVISDSPMFDRGIPSICYGLRGLVYFQIDLRGSSTDLHSGSFGGAVANPAFVLAQMIAQMKDRGGHVKIPNFYDDVKPLQDEERQAWAAPALQDPAYPEGFGSPK